MREVVQAIGEGRLGPRVWLYANYHCNLTCSYCLTESGPGVERREMAPEVMLALTEGASRAGFTSVGVTGGEPFLRPELPAVLAEMSEVLPVVALTNGTLVEGERIARLDPLRGRDVMLQISLDASGPRRNDAMRGPENFARVCRAIPRLLDRGIRVRVATTVYDQDDAEIAAVSELVASLGVAAEDHIVRPTAARGRAVALGLGERVGTDVLEAEATYTVDGLFWSPFAPTVRGGRLDTDLLITRRILPMEAGLRALVGLVAGTPLNQTARFR
jgi:MoaA/NifB/PqqE/SkfB family radical SAM enzyme